MSRIATLLSLMVIIVAACGDGTDGATATSTTSPSGADEPIGGPYAVADLQVTIEHPDRDTVAYRLVCLGDTASIVPSSVPADFALSAEQACTNLGLEAVVDRLVHGPPQDVVCTEIYGGPDVATFAGTLNDQPVNTTVDRANGCGIADWDTVLTGVLPPAVGVTE